MEGFEITKVYRQEVPAMCYVGKKIHNWDFSVMFQPGGLDLIEKHIDENFKKYYEDWNAYCVLHRNKEGEPFEVFYGMFLPDTTPLLEGFVKFDFPKSTLGVCWVYGNESFVNGKTLEALRRLENEGYKIMPDKNNIIWSIERNGCPRFTTPDEKGNVINDVCYYIE
jgi:hypothetical protein